MVQVTPHHHRGGPLGVNFLHCRLPAAAAAKVRVFAEVYLAAAVSAAADCDVETFAIAAEEVAAMVAAAAAMGCRSSPRPAPAPPSAPVRVLTLSRHSYPSLLQAPQPLIVEGIIAAAAGELVAAAGDLDLSGRAAVGTVAVDIGPTLQLRIAAFEAAVADAVVAAAASLAGSDS